MNRNVTGAEYVKAITTRQSDRGARVAFQDLVLRLAAPGATIFDFGSGPGIDARFYAERGFKVSAYDVDPSMCDFFAEHCRDVIEAGRTRLARGDYTEFLTRHTEDDGRADLVTSNFAPLSLIGDLTKLFARFHALTSPDGKVLASVLNPYFRGDLKYRWWWRNAASLWLSGHYSVPGAQAPIVRRRLADFAARSAPYFSLERVYRGMPCARAEDSDGLDISQGARHAWLRLTGCQFIFLLFRKRQMVVQ
jgi:SAM-dependent methyltransferase